MLSNDGKVHMSRVCSFNDAMLPKSRLAASLASSALAPPCAVFRFFHAQMKRDLVVQITVETPAQDNRSEAVPDGDRGFQHVAFDWQAARVGGPGFKSPEEHG